MASIDRWSLYRGALVGGPCTGVHWYHWGSQAVVFSIDR